MTSRWIALVLVLAVAVLGFVAWNQRPATDDASPMVAAEGESPHDAAPADPGIEWDVPRSWSTLESSPMRLATYRTEAVPDAEPAECRVHYFGPGQGGTTEANLERWIGEFENAGPPERTTRTIGGLEVTRVRVKGTYASHGGGMGEADTARGDHELLGAIVVGPRGPVFFKLVGPARTVDAQVDEFDRLLSSVKRKP